MGTVFITDKETAPLNKVSVIQREGTMLCCINTSENRITLKLLLGYENSSLLGFLLKTHFSPKPSVSPQELNDDRLPVFSILLI